MLSNYCGSRRGNLAIVESQRTKGGGFARLGALYLAGLNSEDYFKYRRGYSRYIGHETTHIWWNKADANTWHDWINEGFAEYSALMIIRDFYGEDDFQKWINSKEDKIKDSIPIWEFDRNNTQIAEVNLYSKAPVIIGHLESKIGNEEFMIIYRKVLSENCGKTDQLLSLLKQVSGKEISDWFANLLKSM